MDDVHILNGDSLAQRFPQNISGTKVITRECLIDGDVSGEGFTAFMQTRANFIASYPDFNAQDYLQSSKPEFEKIRKLPQGCNVALWFEEDLFCQVNLWYICSLLTPLNLGKVILVRPNAGNEYSFAHMLNQELLEAYQAAGHLTSSNLALLAECWQAYKKQDDAFFRTIKLPNNLRFVNTAIKAELDRRPDSSGLGRPERELKRIINSLKTEHKEISFSTVFSEFYSKMEVYSFGDLQVKRMFDQLMQ